MFEKEIQFIVDFSLNKVKNLGSFFTFEKLLSTNIHPAILHYISAEIDFLIFEDRKNLIQNSVFDYSGPEIAQYFNLIGEEVKRTRKISTEDIRKLVSQAVSFNVNYIARPKWSLTKLIFNDADQKPIEEIKLSLNYTYYYEYIKNILLSYLNKKNAITISLVEFEVLLSKIDKELFSAQSKKLIDNALYSISDFINNGSNTSKVSIQPVEVFFKEKNLIDYLFRLRRAVPVDSKQKYSIDELRSIIYSSSPIDKEVLSKKEPEEFLKPEEDLIPDTLDDEEITAQNEKSTEELLKELNEPFDFITDKNSIDENLFDEEITLTSPDFEEELITIEEIDEVKDDKIEIELDIAHKDKLDEFYDFGTDLDDEFLEIDEYLPDLEKEELPLDEPELKDFVTDEKDNDVSPVKDLHLREKNNFPNDLFAYLNDKEIDKIVNSVFDEDREDFSITMDRISECSSYVEATEILKSVFLTYRVNPFSREAVTLTNAVANYFNQV